MLNKYFCTNKNNTLWFTHHVEKENPTKDTKRNSDRGIFNREE